VIGAVALVSLVLNLPNAPYVRSRATTTIANNSKAHCLWWPEGTITYQQASKGNPETRPLGSEFTAIHQAFESWQFVMNDCGNLSLLEGPRLAETRIGYDPDRTDNHNTIVFRTTSCSRVAPAGHACWSEETCMNLFDCWEWNANTIALTTATYDLTSGRIFDTDVEFNSHSFVFTTVDSPPCLSPTFHQGCVATDVQNTMTHEAGHVIGLDHTSRSGSTMNPGAPSGEISKRVIDPDSRSFVCDAYPKGKPSRDCIIEPVEDTLGRQVTGCGTTLGAPSLLTGLAWFGLAFRRRSRVQ
jgi:hypothetical protein